MLATATRNDLLALLDWYRAMGADSALQDAPVDWLARGPVAPASGFTWPERGPVGTHPVPAPGSAPSSPPSSAPFQPGPALQSPSPGLRGPSPPPRLEPAARPQTPLAPSAAETDARRIARAATTLEALQAALLGFDGCTLKATAKNLVFYRGAPAARIMLIGEAPGRDEDLEGKPFVGRAGQLLDKMLAAIGLFEADVHITNIVYWRPPGNRPPTPQEALSCRPFLERQIELVAPDFVLLLGGAAAKEVLGVTDGIMKLRGKWRDITVAGRTILTLATLHPAYLLRTPAAKQNAWADLLALKSRYHTAR